VLTYGTPSGTFSSYNLADNGTVAVAPYYRTTALDLFAVVSGTTTFWINPADGDWSTAANWSTNAVPVSSDNAYISTATPVTITHARVQRIR